MQSAAGVAGVLVACEGTSVSAARSHAYFGNDNLRTRQALCQVIGQVTVRA